MMSGGSMDYLYTKVLDAEFSEENPLRKVFKIHLNKVAQALRDIEWVDSYDYESGDEEDAILEVLYFDVEEALMEISESEREQFAALMTKLKAEHK